MHEIVAGACHGMVMISNCSSFRTLNFSVFQLLFISHTISLLLHCDVALSYTKHFHFLLGVV